VITEYLHRTHKRALLAQQDGRAQALTASMAAMDWRMPGVVAASVNGVRHASIQHGDQVEFVLSVRCNRGLEAPHLIFDILDGRGLQLTGRRIALEPSDGIATVRICLQAAFQQGDLPGAHARGRVALAGPHHRADAAGGLALVRGGG